MFQDCKRFLKAAARIETDWPMSKTLTVLWLLFDQNLNLDFNSQVWTELQSGVQMFK